MGARRRTRRSPGGARPGSLSRAHAVQGDDDSLEGLRRPGRRGSRRTDERRNLTRLHLLSRGAAGIARGADHRDARRHQRQLDPRRHRAGAREKSRHRGNAVERGHAAAASFASALQHGVRRPPVRPLRARHARDHPETDAADAARVLSPSLRSRVLHPGRRGAGETRRDPPGRGADAGGPAAKRLPAATAFGARLARAEENRDPAAWGAGLSGDGVARSEAGSCRHAGRRPSRVDARGIALVALAAGAPRPARARQFGELQLPGARGRRRDHGDGAARGRESRPRRGRDLERDPSPARPGRERRRAASSPHARGGRARVPQRDRRGARPAVRPRGDRVAAQRRARVHRSPAIGHAGSDSLCRSTLSGSRELRTSRIRSVATMTRVVPMLGSSLTACALALGVSHAEDQPVARRVLANGLTVLVRENPAVGVVAVALQVRAGSRFETESKAGITNFLHRAMVRGTARRTAIQLATSAEDIGGSIDANGEVEAAEIRGPAPPRHWETLLDLVADVALQPALRPDEIEKERRLILGQIKSRADAPFSFSFDAVLRELYGTNPYGRNQFGLKDSIERLTRDDLLAHYRAIYQPHQMVLAVSGQVERKAVFKAAERLFGRMTRSGPGTQAALPVSEPPGERKVITRPAQQAQILVGYLGPGLADPLYPAARVLSAVLGGGMAGRLFVELRDRRGLADSTSAFMPHRTRPTFPIAYLGAAPARAPAAEGGV